MFVILWGCQDFVWNGLVMYEKVKKYFGGNTKVLKRLRRLFLVIFEKVCSFLKRFSNVFEGSLRFCIIWGCWVYVWNWLVMFRRLRNVLVDIRRFRSVLNVLVMFEKVQKCYSRITKFWERFKKKGFCDYCEVSEMFWRWMFLMSCIKQSKYKT